MLTEMYERLFIYLKYLNVEILKNTILPNFGQYCRELIIALSISSSL